MPPSSQYMRWALLIVITLWLFFAMGATVVIFCYTMNPLSLSLFSTIAPPVYLIHWIVKRIFPEPEDITRLRIRAKAQRAHWISLGDKNLHK